MKKGIFLFIICCMFVWAVFDFVKKDDQTVLDNERVTADTDDNHTSALSMESNSMEETTPIEEGLDRGNVAPDFELETLNGKVLRLSNFKGEKVMLNFWATWCPPCRAEMPDMQRFHENKDVVILAVNLTGDEHSWDNVPKFVEEYGLTFPVLMDENLAVATQYRIKPIPTTYLINSDGTIHNKAFGALNYELMVQEFNKMH